jgi:mono/diheme cytochrome c family protein
MQLLLALFPAAELALSGAESQPPKGVLTYERDIRPIFKAYCFQCHGEGEKLKGGLDLRLRQLIAKGGESGPAFMPGKPDKSLLYQQVVDGEMPKGEKKLTKDQVALIGRWIAGGAKTARPEPAEVSAVPVFTEEERTFWAFQPIRRPQVPKVNSRDIRSVRNPIDAFLLARLNEKKLTYSPTADRVTLIRRATFDLTGLPPTPEEVDTFVADPSPLAYERLIDRLLDSPHYGEVWGRHWLDIAGYADSDGFSESDPVRPYAYKYRDYVIRSFNSDKPFNQFVQEQLAGDEMAKKGDLSPEAVEKLVATGFLRMGPDGTGSPGVEQKVARNQVVADTIKIVSTSLMGITVGCAQCHDHRHDPILQTDYYRFRAVFEPAFDTRNWRAPGARLVSLMSEADRAKAKEIEAEAAKLDAATNEKRRQFIQATLEKELVKKPEELREPLRTAYNLADAKRTPEQKKLLKEHPTVGNLSSGSLYLYEQKLADELKRMSDKAAEVRATKPVEDFVQPLTEVAGATNPPTFLFHRGDPDQPKQAVKPGEPLILASYRPVEIPEKDATSPTSGRRMALARSLTDGAHPLTTRVLVNRVWLLHFGRGLVATPGDFGHLGERPSHPELLDWLAGEFVAQGWSLKKLHKMIMTSAAYQQSSKRDPKKEKLDPDNRLLSRMPVRRLDGEIIRDAMLAVSGKLNPKMFGKPIPIMEDEVGQVVVGVDTNDTAGRPTGKIVPMNNEEFRRSIYVQVRRTKPLGMLEAFDAPIMEPNCENRSASTVAPQSLMLMNGEFTQSQADHLAQRVARDAGDSDDARARRAWRLALAREPAPADIRAAVEFLSVQTAFFREHAPAPVPVAKGKTPPPAPDPREHALACYCQALLTSNPFLYVD